MTKEHFQLVLDAVLPQGCSIFSLSDRKKDDYVSVTVCQDYMGVKTYHCLRRTGKEWPTSMVNTVVRMIERRRKDQEAQA